MATFNLIPYAKEKGLNTVIKTEINHNKEEFFLSFRILGSLDLIDFGSNTPCRERKKNLWEKTCFEVFIKNENNQYIEFNFSPNFEWNCYFFDKKGDPLKELESMTRPECDILNSFDCFFAFFKIKKGLFPADFFKGLTLADNKLEVGITCVLKSKKGTLSYWALSHPDIRPNFHHFESFKYKF